MTSDERIHIECREVSERIPWYINGTISEDERQQVDPHLLQCANCRDELNQDRLVYQGMNAEAAVEHLPAASLKRLQARLDAIDGAAAPTEKPDRPTQWQGLLAASIVVMAVAICLLAADRWIQFRARTSAANYYTVTTPEPHAPGELIRAVFSPTITLADVQTILDEAGLRIVSGPTEAEVYSLAANSSRPVSSSLATLRANAKVRFAESIQSSLGSADSP